MSTTGRRKNSPVTQLLEKKPEEYAFFQAVRLLERCAVHEAESADNIASKPVAKFTPPSKEAIRFLCHQTLAFPSTDIHYIKKQNSSKGEQQWELAVNLLGLTGVKGILPYHYTELILQRIKQKDDSLLKFLDLFNHRTVSLFYQAALKYRLAIDYERKHLNHKDEPLHGSHTQALLSLIGLGTEKLSNRLHVKDESLVYYSGLLTQKVRTSSGLKHLLKHHFNVPVEINEFVGQWQPLIDDVRTQLPSRTLKKGMNNCLGKSVMLGSNGWFAQGKIKIILGPLNRQQLHQFAPGTKALKSLDELVRFYVGLELDYDFIIRINRNDVPNKIQLKRKDPPIMGWNTWLASQSSCTSNTNETLDISVSARRFR